ncbi:MAG: penicillin-binding protein 2 [Pseudomonadota bacterium]
MGEPAVTEAPPIPNGAERSAAENATAQRRRIVDRHGVTLATNLKTFELYFDADLQPHAEDRREAAAAIARRFPGLDQRQLAEKFLAGGTSLVTRPATPRQVQAARDLGLPGMYARERFDRIFPMGRETVHLLGKIGIDGDGLAGIEAALDETLSEESEHPLRLSLDLRAQRAVREELANGIAAFKAKAGSAIVLDAKTGEIAALVSLPDYDPTDPPKPPATWEEAEQSPLYSRAVAGRYELGSVFKVFTWALALEAEVALPHDTFPAPKPFRVAGHVIRDDHPIRQPVSFGEAFARSSNIVAASLALNAGRPAQFDMFEALGLHVETSVELAEARGKAPFWHEPWTRSTTAATAYGHAVAVTPLHLASAVASIINGGTRVSPTLLLRDEEAETSPPARVVSTETSAVLRDLMRMVVTDGTGRRAAVVGLDVGGKTGTAEKPAPSGGYYDDRVMASFVAAFPMEDPAYVVLVTLDEPVEETQSLPRRSAGLTAAPVTGAVIRRVAPLLGVVPSSPALPTSEIR